MLLSLISHRPVKNPTADVPVVDLGRHAEDNYYDIARWLMDGVDWFLHLIGQPYNQTLFTICYATLIFIISFGAGWILQKLIVFTVTLTSRHWKNDLYMLLAHSRFFNKFFRIVPGIVFLIFIQFTLTRRATLAGWLTRFDWIFIIYVLADSFSTLARVVWMHVDARENKRKLPLKGIVQLVNGIIWILALIVILAIIFNKSPGSLLAGVGAFAAVLMLVFKDSILGVVAGVQLSENDSLHVGDWIKVAGTDANGIVTEVSLTAVKVQNFDKTVTTLPPYNLVSGSFTNYRPMQESGTRRIMRCYMIDADSVVPMTEELLDEFAKIPLMSDWIAVKRSQKAAGKIEDVNNSAGLADGSIETNLGIFRAYLVMYLNRHNNIAHDQEADTCFVRTLDQTNGGIPLQIYCFTNTSQWIPYEGIQSALFEHIAVMLAKFRLYTFENPTGRDEIVNGILEAGVKPDPFFGIPYPMYVGGGNPAAPGVMPQNSPTQTVADKPSGN